MNLRTFTIAVAAFAGAASVFAAWNSTITAQTANLPIHGSGSWRSNAAGTGQWRVDLALDGDALRGILAVSNNPALGVATVAGKVSGNSLTLSVIQAGQRVAVFSGGLSATLW